MHKVLIANRGAIARRVIRACRESGLRSVAVYSEADAAAPYLAEADEAYALTGNTPAETYLNQSLLLQTAQRCRADAVHPGYGFLSERADFAEAVVAAGLTFIGPSPRWLAQMGDKIAARQLMQEVGFPTFAGSEAIQGVEHAQQLAQQLGYPLVVKPAGGGGGMGMQVVHDQASLSRAVHTAAEIGQRAFGHAEVYLERWLEQPRHIEFQILADGQGHAVHAFERECSVQRRHQKLIEESPAPGIEPARVTLIAEQAAQVCAQLGYDNVGTLETLFSNQDVGFLEMNTRIQVEHGVTEAVTGLDLVQWQIRLAQGESLPSELSRQGYAVEARLYAEDPQQFLPSTGRLAVFRPPQMYGVRVETGYQQGQMITPYYDPMLAKLIAIGDTREMAIGRLMVALKAFEVSGVQTNTPLLLRVLQDQQFLQGQVDTGIVARILQNNRGE